MTKARDISSLIGSSGQIDNTKITLDVNEIPNLDANKIATGSLGVDRIPALDAGKITTGTFADARISNSSVSQHATSFDDNKLVNDISTLAIRQASNENKGAYNTNSMYVDVFQDSTGYINGVDTIRNTDEYISSGTAGNTASATTNLILKFNNNTNDSSGYSNNPTGSGGTITYDAIDKKFGSHAAYFDGSDYLLFNQGDGGVWFGSGDWAVDFWCKPNAIGSDNYRSFYGHQGQDGSNYHQLNFLQTTPYLHSYNDVLDATSQPLTIGSWNHVLVQRYNNKLKFWVNGNLCNPSGGLSLSKNINTTNDFGVGYDGGNIKYKGMYDEFRIVKHAPTVTVGDALYIGNDTGNFTPPTQEYVLGSLSATGNFTCPTITAPSSVSSMGAIITYQDNAGTNALNTDIVLQLSADGGSNYSTATLTALPDFSTGIKMAKVNDLAIGTSGTQLKYKISFANQSSGSKEARIRGVSLNY